MAQPLRRPGIAEQRVREELEIALLLEPSSQARWNQLVVEGHQLPNATLVGEPLRYAARGQGQWLALLGWRHEKTPEYEESSESCLLRALPGAAALEVEAVTLAWQDAVLVPNTDPARPAGEFGGDAYPAQNGGPNSP